MTDILQLEQPVELHDVPKLLIEWSSRWREFLTAIRPALVRSEARLAGEAPYGMFPYRGMVPCWLIEAFLIFAAIVVPVKLRQLRPYVAPQISTHDIIYYSGDELPRIEDVAGAQAGTSGRAGGSEAHHRTQTIRIARGGSLTPKVVDAPNLRLPPTRDAVANLLAMRPNPGPPPLEGVRSSRSTPNLAAAVIAPAPNVIRDYTRNGIAMEAVVPPAPNFSRDQPLTAPTLNANVIPPAPIAKDEHTLVAPALGPAVIPPAPNASRDRARTGPALSDSVVAPAPSVSRDQGRSAPSLAASVIPPAPGSVTREMTSAPVQMANVAVVPPPVSAPEKVSSRNAKITVPAPAVIAPPPSADVTRDVGRLASGSVPDPSKSVVPPPPTQSGSGSFMSSLIGKIFGTSDVVPPPPTVNAGGGNTSRSGAGGTLAANVVPPPPSVGATGGGGDPHGARNGAGTTLGSNVIAPPPSAGVSGGTGPRTLSPAGAPSLGPPSIVPPPPALSGPGGGTGSTGGGRGVAGGTQIANNVVPPPPSVGGGSSATGSGLGRRGTGLGSPLDVGSAAAPPTSGGSSTNAGIVASSNPGSKVGLPAAGGTGSLAMSPAGGDKPGLGGSGGGTGIGRGNGPGSGLKGEGPGAGKSGSGRGSDASARGGISPSPGPGGAGSAASGNPAVPGVSVSGGSVQVSFDTDPAKDSNSSASSRSSIKPRKQTLEAEVVGTASSGGAFEPYKNLLHGEKHTIYLDTSLGTVVMEYADESSAGHGYAGSLIGPQQIRTDLPDGLPHAYMKIVCKLDASGSLKNIRVLDPGPAEMTAKVIAALNRWKFRPALRGKQPVEVTAILGFNIDTNDRF